VVVKGWRLLFIFWIPIFQTSASTQIIITEEDTTYAEARLSPFTQFQLHRQNVVKQTAEFLLQLWSSDM